MVSPIETLLQEKEVISTTHRWKKNVMKETAICECIFKKGHFSSVSDL